MNHFIKVIFLTIFALCATVARADERIAPKQGSARGRIIDEAQQTLPGAAIYIEQLQIYAVSDARGYYTLTNLAPGIYRIRVSYVGYTPVETDLVIPAGSTLDKDIVLHEGIELQEVVIGGAFQGQRRAIASQQNSLGIKNVVSAVQVGKFPDANIGDALKRVAGINVQYDQGEARFGQVRGTAADMSSVSIDGNRIPSAEGDTRNVQLDLIPAEMIQTIEVNKVVTPDMDADAIGGAINLITKSSPYKRTIVATAGSGYNAISQKAQLNLGFTYGDRFFDGRLGVMLSASYQNNPAGSDNTEFVWDQDVESGTLLLTDYQVRQYYLTRERQSYSGAIDWKLSKNHRLTLKAIFNNRNDWENRYRLTLKGLNLDEDKAGNSYATENNKATVRIQTKGGTERNARLERQRTFDLSLSGEHLFGPLTTEWNINYATAGERRPNERYIDYQLKKQLFTPDLSDPRQPLYTPQEGSTLTLSDKFSLKEITQEQGDIMERDIKLRLDFKLPVSANNRGKLSFGAKVVRKSKEKTKDYYEYSPLDETTFDAASLAAATDQNRKGFMAGEKYQAGSFVSKEYLGSLELDNASLFDKEESQEKKAEGYRAREVVAAGYARYDQQLGKQWSLMVGVRLENTHLNTSGYRYDAENDVAAPTAGISDNYLNVLPSLLVKWDATDKLKLRASFTNTISRPKYTALIPSVTIKTSDNTLALGNPGLKPTLSYNFDTSGEYYFKSIGLVSAGVFIKLIDDFIVDQTLLNHTYEGTVYNKFSQPRNSGNATLVGAELAYQRDFGFLTPTLKCIGLYANYTYTHSRVSHFNFTGRENENGLSLPGSPTHTANASLSFEKAGVSVRLSYNFASAFIDEMGASAFYDRYYDRVGYLDANASYTFGRKLKTTFYVEATNLLNQPLRYYQGIRERTMQVEYYGVKVNAGIKINL
ncbi:MAG: TonB-dependent receptor [Mediterranea sp.]|nr:TonB-dependent receptor [Mediterranea sp.]